MPTARCCSMLLCSLTLLTTLRAESKISFQQLPPAVQKAAEAASQGAKVVGYAKEKEKGQTFYEVELKVDGATRDITFDEKGNTVSVEQQVALSSVPQAVQDALHKAAGKGTITLLESVTKGSAVTYEAAIKNGPKKEVTVDAQGNPVKN